MLDIESTDKFYATKEHKSFYDALKAKKVFDRFVHLFCLAAAIGLREGKRMELGQGREELFNAPTMPDDLRSSFSLILSDRHSSDGSLRPAILLSEYAAWGLEHLKSRWENLSDVGILRDVYRLLD